MSVRPDITASRIASVNVGNLAREGIIAIIIDLDNTLTAWNDRTIPADVVTWMKKALEIGLSAVILSNNKKDRVSEIAAMLNVPYVADAGKPRPQAFFNAAKLVNAEPSRCAVIGDQYFTDVLGGHRAGMRTVLLRPISKREFVGTRFMRIIEFITLRLLNISR